MTIFCLLIIFVQKLHLIPFRSIDHQKWFSDMKLLWAAGSGKQIDLRGEQPLFRRCKALSFNVIQAALLFDMSTRQADLHFKTADFHCYTGSNLWINHSRVSHVSGTNMHDESLCSSGRRQWCAIGILVTIMIVVLILFFALWYQ